ncbi:MAG: SNF2 helicase-associated domain-containing protein, partial [Thermoplasmata archaeon]
MPNGTMIMGQENRRAYFPAFGEIPMPSPQLAGIIADANESSENNALTMRVLNVPSVIIDIKEAFIFLTRIDEFNKTEAIIGDDLRFWENVARFTYNILSDQKFLPTVVEESTFVRSRWISMLETYKGQSVVEDLSKDMPFSCLAFNYGEIDPKTLIRTYINKTVDRICRCLTKPPESLKSEGDVLKWVASLSGKNSLITYGRSLAIQKISNWSRMIEFRLEFPLRMSFDLVPPENKSDLWELRFLVQSKSDPSLIIPFDNIWKNQDKDTVSMIKKFTDFPEEFLLQSLSVAQMIYPPIKKALQSAYPSEVQLDSDEVYNFLKNYSSVLGESGFSILFPEWWVKKDKNLGVKVKVQPVSGGGGPILGLETLVNYSLDVVSDGKPISVKDLEKLSNLKANLVQIGRRWIEVDHDQLKKLLKIIKDSKKNVPLVRFLSMTADNDMPPVVEISAKGWLKTIFNEKTNFTAI